MLDQDRPAFAALLTATLEVYGAPLTPDAISIWWSALQKYPLQAVRNGLSAHVTNPERGRFPPRPADVIAALTSQDGHPGADEAWACCPLNESQSVVWTEQIRRAFFSGAYDLLATGDAIAARMAFRDAYNRLLLAARAEGVPAVWEASLGTDAHGREPALREAVERGRLPTVEAARLLPQAHFGPTQQQIESRA